MICTKCGGEMKPSKAIAQTIVGDPEWQDSDVATKHYGGPGVLIDCLKCEKCGFSMMDEKK